MGLRKVTESSDFSLSPSNGLPFSLDLTRKSSDKVKSNETIPEPTPLCGRDVSLQTAFENISIVKILQTVNDIDISNLLKFSVKEDQINSNQYEESSKLLQNIAILFDKGNNFVLDKITEETPPEEIKLAQEEKRLAFAREDDQGNLQIEAAPEIAEKLKNAEEIEYRSPKGTRTIPKLNFSVTDLTNDELNKLNTAVRIYIIYIELFPQIKSANKNEENSSDTNLNNLPKQDKILNNQENVEKKEKKDFNEYFFADMKRQDLFKYITLINISKQFIYDKDANEDIKKEIRDKETRLLEDIIITVIKADDLKFNNKKSDILNQSLKKSINKIIRISFNRNGEQTNIYLVDGKTYIK